MTPKGTHIQHQSDPMTEVKGQHVTVSKPPIVRSRTYLLTTLEMAKILGVSRFTIDRRAASGQLKAKTIGGTVRFDAFENGVNEYVELLG